MVDNRHGAGDLPAAMFSGKSSGPADETEWMYLGIGAMDTATPCPGYADQQTVWIDMAQVGQSRADVGNEPFQLPGQVKGCHHLSLLFPGKPALVVFMAEVTAHWPC